MRRVLACGAWLKNTACLLEGDGVRWSALHGDLSTPQACLALEASARRLVSRGIDGVAHDLHPDFFSTRVALALAAEFGVPAIAVQHHHAHIAAVMAEHGVDEPVVGLALDGVGHGCDGTAWGGELLWVAPQGWQRLGHLHALALPGGDVAAREPWRMAAAALHALGRSGEIEPRFQPAVGAALAQGVQQMLAASLRCPPSSSAGRWFDAAAGALGLSVRQAEEAEAAMALERTACAWLQQGEAVAPLAELDTTAAVLDLRPLLQRLLRCEGPTGHEAAWFHLSLAQALADWAAAAARAHDTRTVCLGGGCFFNQLLRARVVERLRHHGLRALLPERASCGDAGLALGQAWVARHQIPSPHPEAVSCA